MSFEIRINGVLFELWETANLKRSIDTNCGAFRFTNSSTIPGEPYPVKSGDSVNIVINGITLLTGFVDQVSIVSDDKRHTITVSGRDTIADLVDSSVPESAKVNEGPITLKRLCERVVSALGASIPVKEEITTAEFTTEDLQAAGSGDNAIEFLTSFARKRQVYLISDGLGSLVIFRPNIRNKTSPIIRKVSGVQNNIKASESTVSKQGRFNSVICRSADNFGFSFSADYKEGGTNRNGTATDSDIRASRFLEIQAEESMDDQESIQRAKEEINIRRARGESYNATVAGFAQNNGQLWDFGKFVPVIDEYANVQGTMLIKSIDMSIDIQLGSRTKLTCARVDAYQVVDQVPVKDARKSKIGVGINA